MESAYPTYELLEIARLSQEDIRAIWEYLVLLPLVLALIPPVPLKWRWILLRVVVVTVVVWVALMAFHTQYIIPWHRRVLDIQQYDPMYDGVAGNVGLLLFGWILPLAMSFVPLAIIKVLVAAFSRIITTRRRSGGVSIESGLESFHKGKVRKHERE